MYEETIKRMFSNGWSNLEIANALRCLYEDVVAINGPDEQGGFIDVGGMTYEEVRYMGRE